MKRVMSFLSLFALMLGVGLFAANSGAVAGELKIKDLKEGTGKPVIKGVEVTVHYTGWTLDGKKFDSSLDRGQPFKFTPGAHRVIKGWEKGILGMKVGGKRELVIPPELAYGKRGAGGAIPPNATLRFQIELLAFEEPKFKNVGNDEAQKLLKQGVKLIDIRLPEEWKETGIIKGATLMTFFGPRGRVNPSFLKRFKEMVKPKDKVMLICRTGSRTGVVSQYLAQQVGFEGIVNIKRGIMSWLKEKKPVVKAVMPEPCWLCKK